MLEKKEGKKREVKDTDNYDINLLIKMRIVQQRPRGGCESGGADAAGSAVPRELRLTGCQRLRLHPCL